ncbi:MAG: DNA repair protein RadC [Chitinophagia bacterium]|nr:DNA repair protein RadC [Chitinophagia bacterium]
MPDYISIKHRHESERPREKMLLRGAEALNDAELLAILIGTGTKEKSAIDLMRELLDMADNNLLRLGRLSLEELQSIKGIGEAKAITIVAAMELGKRRQMTEAIADNRIRGPRDAGEMLAAMIGNLRHEEFWAVYLDNQCCIIGKEKIAEGGITEMTVDVKKIIKGALLKNANRILLAHNHPSGSLEPSEHDKLLTKRIKQAAHIFEIQLFDHIIVAGNLHRSMGDRGHIQ